MRARAALLLPLVLVASCATAKRGFQIKVNAPGARIYEGAEQVLNSHGLYMLEVGRDHTLRVEANGYEPQELVLKSYVSGLRVLYTVGTSLCMPIIVLPLMWPLWIGKGYWYEFEPEEPEVVLKKIPGWTAPVVTRPEPARPTPRPSPPPRNTPAPRPQPATPARLPATTPTPSPRANFCGDCGAPLPDAARFCGGCGKPRTR